jgi:hypothetical protein
MEAVAVRGAIEILYPEKQRGVAVQPKHLLISYLALRILLLLVRVERVLLLKLLEMQQLVTIQVLHL